MNNVFSKNALHCRLSLLFFVRVRRSYPGFLSALMRLHFSDVVDIGYASSAPMLLYSMDADQMGYYDKVTETADIASPGCADAVRQTLATVDSTIRTSTDFLTVAHSKLNICPGTIPKYIDNNDLFAEEVLQIVADTFADMNMDNYPPTEETKLEMVCKKIFQDESIDEFGRLSKFWKHLEDNIDLTLPCFDMSSQLPDGPDATFSSSDWTGVGPGYDGMMWDFQCCTTLTPPVGFSHQSMFPYREWSLEWLTDHCMKRFDVTPNPYYLVDKLKFNDLVGQGATRILFTNGLKDIWSMGSYLEDLSDSIVVVNMKNGAHHSELSYSKDMKVDTDDVKEGHKEITKILSKWLKEIKEEMVN